MIFSHFRLNSGRFPDGLSIPSAVLAEASWYGSLRVGWESGKTSGFKDYASRWGIKGSNDVSDGLSAVYRFEQQIDATTATQGDDKGRLSYVGLSGGFGTVAMGKVNNAAGNHFGAIVDNSTAYGDSEIDGTRSANVISYSVGIGSVSAQIDLTGNNGGGATSNTENGQAVSATNPKHDDKDIDSSQFGLTLQLGENAKVGLTHVNYDEDEEADESRKMSAVAGEYTVGGMTLYLGYGQTKYENIDDVEFNGEEADVKEGKSKTTFFGARGGLGDTGVSFLLQVRNKKISGDQFTNDDKTQTAEIDIDKHSPWMFGLSRSLGGGASVSLEHSNPDVDDEKSKTSAWLTVNF